MTTYIETEPTLANANDIEMAALVTAAERGDVVIDGSPLTLMIDLDGMEGHKRFAEAFPLLQKSSASVQSIDFWPSKSGYPNLHILITVDVEMVPMEQLTWQLLLGSDPARERWNAARILLEQSVFQRLFKPARCAKETFAPILLYCVPCQHLTALTHKQYMYQLKRPDDTWRCMACGAGHCGVIEI